MLCIFIKHVLKAQRIYYYLLSIIIKINEIDMLGRWVLRDKMATTLNLLRALGKGPVNALSMSVHFRSLPLTSAHFRSLQFTSVHFRSLPFTSAHFRSSLPFTSVHCRSILIAFPRFCLYPHASVHPMARFPGRATQKSDHLGPPQVGGFGVGENRAQSEDSFFKPHS